MSGTATAPRAADRVRARSTPLSAIVGSELLKLRTTRTTIALVGSALALVTLIVALAAATGDWDAPQELTPAEDLIGVAGVAQLFALVLGILAVSTEVRHGTITPSLLVVPDRVRLVVGKLVVHLLAGLALGVAAVAIALAVSALVFALRDVDAGITAALVLEQGVGNVVAIALWCALGVGVGALIRNQVGAIVGALAYVFVVESLLTIVPGLQRPIERYGLGGVTEGLAPSGFADADTLAQLPAGLLLAAYVAVLVVLGTVALRRRDVTG